MKMKITNIRDALTLAFSAVMMIAILAAMAWALPASAGGYYGYPQRIIAKSLAANGAISGHAFQAAGGTNPVIKLSDKTDAVGFAVIGDDGNAGYMGIIDTNNIADMVKTIQITTSGAQITGSLDVSGAVISSKPCAAGYTRLTPNYCAKSGGGSMTAFSAACTEIPVPAADARAVKIAVDGAARSANAVAWRYAMPKIYTDSACTAFGSPLLTPVNAYEFSAVNGAQILASMATEIDVVLSSPGASLYQVETIDAGGASYAQYAIVGYYD